MESREVTGTRQPGAVQADEPLSPTGPVAEFDRMYRRLHPIRFSVARRLARMEREQQRAREIEAIRDLTRDRRDIFDQLSNLARQSEPLVERNLQRLRDEDPLNQFNLV